MSTILKGYPTLNTGAEQSYDVTVTQFGSLKSGLDTVEYYGGSNLETNVVFGESLSVASASRTLIVSYTVPIGKTANLERIEFDGNNIAVYELEYGGSVKARKNTYYSGPLFGIFDYSQGKGDGIELSAGSLVSLYVEHQQPYVGDFSATIQVTEY